MNPVGYSGGLALLWKHSVNISFKYVDRHLVDFSVQMGNDFLCLVYMGNRSRKTDQGYGKDCLVLELIEKKPGV